jgi:hypothetical protein
LAPIEYVLAALLAVADGSRLATPSSMIHWKVTALSLAFGAAATAGFVWLSRSFGSRRRLSTPEPSAPHDKLATPDDVARADALRDLRSDGDLSESSGEEPIDVRSLDEEPLAGDEPVLGDEHYDAIDPEDIGTEWLRRATEAPEPASNPQPFSEEFADVAAELPVGSIDSEGNTELHLPARDRAPGTELSPNETELAQRGATEAPHEDPKKPHE